MSEDYFGDTSDADFLALAQQLEPRENNVDAGNKSKGSGAARLTVPKITTPSTTIGVRNAETSQPDSSRTAPRVLRPGFNAVIVNTRQVTILCTVDSQRGNPILEHIRNVPWEYGDILPDYVLGTTTCALFLSLRYHRLHPEYIYNRIQKLGKEYNLRILLIMDNHSDPLRELTKTSLVNDYTVILAWSAAEAGRYIETIKQHQATDYPTRLIETLTTIRSVNKNDAVSLVTNFGSLSRAINAPLSQIATLGGWGPQKIERFEKTVSEPFIIKTGIGGAIGLGKKLKGGRWMVDQEGADVLEEVESTTYRNAAMPSGRKPLQQGPMEDERMPEEWNRARNQQGEVIGFVGQRPIARPVREEEMEGVVGTSGDSDTESGSGVMAALARLRQQQKN